MSQLDDFLKTDIAFKGDFISTPTGDLDVISGLANLKEALFRRLVTVQGGLIHRPEYGVGVKRYIGATASLGNKQRLANLIKEQFEEDPRVEVVNGVSFTGDDNKPETIILNVRLSVVGYGETQIKFVPFGEV